MGPEEEKTFTVEYGPKVEAGPEPAAGMKLEEGKTMFTVRSGGMVYVVPRDLKGLLTEVRDGKKEFTRPGSPGLAVRTGKKDLHAVGGAGFKGQVIRQGPLAVALRFEGETRLADTRKARSVVEMTFPRSKSWIELNWTLSSDDLKAGDALEVDLNLLVKGTPTLVDFGAGSLVYTTLAKGESAILNDFFPIRRQGAAPRWEVSRGRGEKFLPLVKGSTRPGEGWAHVMDRQRCTALAVGTDRQQFAGLDRYEIRIAADGRLRLRASAADPKQRKGGRGAIRLRCWLHFVDMPVQVGALTSPQSMKAPLEVTVKASR
jgi:hypothetical protein